MKDFKIRVIACMLFIVPGVVFSQTPCSSDLFLNGEDFVEPENTPSINLQDTRNRTTEFWFKAPNIEGKQVIYEEGGGVRAIFFYLYEKRIHLGGYRDIAAFGNRRFFRSGTLVVDRWYHVAFTIEDPSDPNGTLLEDEMNYKWYLNGVLQNTHEDTQNGPVVDSHDGTVTFGKNGSGLLFPDNDNNWTSAAPNNNTQTYTGPFTLRGVDDNPDFLTEYNYTGTISLFRIWNVAKTQEEIDANKSILLTSGLQLAAYLDQGIVYYDPDEITDPSIENMPSEETSIITNEFTWNGSVSSNWTDTDNWVDDEAPSLNSTQNITIKDDDTDPILTTLTNVGSLTIETDATLTINSGATLNVYYNFANYGTVTVKDGGSLIYHNCNIPILTGNPPNPLPFDIQKKTPTYTGSDFYSYWSSPVIGSAANKISDVFPDAEIVYIYNANPDDPDDYANWEQVPTSGNMIKGVGYAIQNEGAGAEDRSFKGDINNGSKADGSGPVEVKVYYNKNVSGSDPDGTQWSLSGDNLVGNPYASALDWDNVITDTDNSEIHGTIYYWNQTKGGAGANFVSDYKQYNLSGGTGNTNTATGNIASGQGFFVRMIDPQVSQADDNEAIIAFKPTHQINGSNTLFYRGKASKDKTTRNIKKQNRSWFTFSRGTQFNNILVAFLEDATNQLDRLYDAPFDITQESLGFYSLIKNKYKASIQGLPVLKRDKKVVKLGFAVDQIGEHTIAIQEEYIDPDYYIYLRDREKKITVDLRQRSYTFSIDSVGENNMRFKLIYTKKKRKATTSSKEKNPIVTEIDTRDFSVYIDEVKDLIIEYDYDQDNIKQAFLYNLRGQRIQRFDGKSNPSVAGLETGVYLVEATLFDGRKRIKKLVIAK